MSASILHLRAEDRDGPWRAVAEPRNHAAAIDELASWQGPRLHRGDMALVRWPPRQGESCR